MNKFYSFFALTAFCLLTLTSCSRKFNFTTKGLTETDSSYLVTTDGKHIDASVIEVRTNNELKVDGQVRSLDDLSAIKSKKMYFGIKDGNVYAGEIYGKICLLYKMEMGPMTYSQGGYGGVGNGGTWSQHPSKVEYIQKKGSADIDKLNNATLIDYVSDNDGALSKAKGAKTWQLVSIVPAVGFAGGIVWSFVDLLKLAKTTGETANLGPPLLLVGVSLPVYIATTVVANHKLHKAIKIYNKQ